MERVVSNAKYRAISNIKQYSIFSVKRLKFSKGRMVSLYIKKMWGYVKKIVQIPTYVFYFIKWMFKSIHLIQTLAWVSSLPFIPPTERSRAHLLLLVWDMVLLESCVLLSLEVVSEGTSSHLYKQFFLLNKNSSSYRHRFWCPW